MSDDVDPLVAEQRRSYANMNGSSALAGLIRGDSDDGWMQPEDLIARLDEEQREIVLEAAEKLVAIIENMRGAG